MKRTTEDTLSLLGGVGIGMLAMYLLDPQSGARRRAQIAAATREAVDTAGETVAPVIGSVAAGVSRVGRNIAETVSEYGHEAYDTSRDYISRAGERLSRGASDVGEYSAEHASSLWHGGKRRLGLERERQFPVAGTAAAAGGIGLLALGAGLAWLFDPDRGEARRHWLRDKGFSFLRDAGDLCRKTGRHISNYTYGTYAEARSMMRRDEPTDAQLEARVRSELGRVVRNMSDVTVIADNGMVTLIGTLPQDEIQSAETSVRAVRGVRDVNSQLRARTEPSPSPQQF